MTSFRNNEPTMTPSEVMLWEQRLKRGALFSSVETLHGSLHAYFNLGCRCDECKAKARAYRQSRKVKR